MVRDTAERQLAYYYVQLGELQQDPEMIAHGVNSVIDVFEKQPNMDDLVVLRKWAEILRHEELARYVYRYSDIPDNLPEVGGGGM